MFSNNNMPGRKSKKSNSDIRQLANMLGRLSVSAVPPQPARRKRKQKRKRAGPSAPYPSMEGEIRISRAELIDTVKVKKTETTATGYKLISPSEFAFLKKVGAAFARSKWIQLKVYYKPAVGTTYGGLVSLGFMLDPDTSVTVTRANVVAMTPSATTAAWMDTEDKPLVLKGTQLATRDWYFHNDANLKYADRAPGMLYWAVDVSAAKDDTVVGEMWLHYTLVMQGTNSS